MLLSSGVTTIYLGWTKSRAPEILGGPKRFFGEDFSKLLLIDLPFNYASIQWRNNHVSGVDKVQGPKVLGKPSSDFWGLEVFHAIYFILFFQNFH